MIFGLKHESLGFVFAIADQDLEDRGSFKNGSHSFMDLLTIPGALLNIAQQNYELKITAHGEEGKPYIKVSDAEVGVDIGFLLQQPNLPIGQQLDAMLESLNNIWNTKITSASFLKMHQSIFELASYLTTSEGLYDYVDFDGFLENEAVSKNIDRYRIKRSNTRRYLENVINRNSNPMSKATDELFVKMPEKFQTILKEYRYLRLDPLTGIVSLTDEEYHELQQEIEELLPDDLDSDMMSGNAERDMWDTSLSEESVSIRPWEVIPISPYSNTAYKSTATEEEIESLEGNVNNNFLVVPQTNESRWHKALVSLLEYDAYTLLVKEGISEPSPEQIEDAVRNNKLSDATCLYMLDLCIAIARINWSHTGGLSRLDSYSDDSEEEIDSNATNISPEQLHKFNGEETFKSYLKGAVKGSGELGGYCWANIAVMLARFDSRRPTTLCIPGYSRYWDFMNWQVTWDSGARSPENIVFTEDGCSITVTGVVLGPPLGNDIVKPTFGDVSIFTAVPIGLLGYREYKLGDGNVVQSTVLMSMFDVYQMYNSDNYSDKLKGVSVQDGKIVCDLDVSNVSFSDISHLVDKPDERFQILQSTALKAAIMRLGNKVKSDNSLNKITHYSAMKILSEKIGYTSYLRVTKDAETNPTSLVSKENVHNFKRNMSILLLSNLKPYLETWYNVGVPKMVEMSEVTIGDMIGLWMECLDGYEDAIPVSTSTGSLKGDLNKNIAANTLKKINIGASAESKFNIEDTAWVSLKDLPSGLPFYRILGTDGLVCCTYTPKTVRYVCVFSDTPEVSSQIKSNSKLESFKQPLNKLKEAIASKDFTGSVLRVESEQVMNKLEEALK